MRAMIASFVICRQEG